MRAIADITGQRFGRWTAIHLRDTRRAGSGRVAYWDCRCDCGTIKAVNGINLRLGLTMSCGCVKAIVDGLSNITHGLTKTPEYGVWSHMKRRCEDPSDSSYERYGGRGIRVCERWSSFELFIEDMRQRPTPRHSIERLHNDGNYEPDNCVWGTKKEQARNRRSNRIITVSGDSQCMAVWADRTGISIGTLWNRLSHGWSHERTVSTPVRGTL